MSKAQSQKAVEYVRRAYENGGWQVQMSPRGAMTTFTAVSRNKLHHVRVLLGEHDWLEGEKINFVQNAVSNMASPVAATYVELPARDGVKIKCDFFDLNQSKSLRIKSGEPKDDAAKPKAKGDDSAKAKDDAAKPKAKGDDPTKAKDDAAKPKVKAAAKKAAKPKAAAN